VDFMCSNNITPTIINFQKLNKGLYVVVKVITTNGEMKTKKLIVE
jgi:hypothetical protein